MDKQQWTEYWSGGALHSLAGDFTGNYTGKIAEFWRAEFQQLEPGARILDVATGNGAIALHALAVSDEQQMGFSVEACDLAAIEPAATVSDPELKRQLERIVFHPETNIEATDFDRGTFDLLTSQFGFEYANLSAGAKEIARLLSEQGRFAAIMHHPNSYILITTNGDRQQCRWLMEDFAIFARARELIEQMGEVSLPERRAAMAKENEVLAARDRLNQAVKQVSQQAAKLDQYELTSNTLKAIQEILVKQSQDTLANRLSALNHLEQQLKSSLERIDDLRSAVVDHQRTEELHQAFEKEGFKVEKFEPFVDEYQTIVGWLFIAEKAPV